MTPLDTTAGVALLDQASYWQAKGDEGQLVRLLLDDMTDDHRSRTLAWLRQHAEQMQDHRRDIVARLHRRGLLDAAAFAAELRYLDALDPHVWLEDQPLVRRLVQLVPRPAPRPRRGLLRRWRR